MSKKLVNKIANTINKMLLDTSTMINKDKEDWTLPKYIASAALPLVCNYCHSILILAEEKCKLPTKALLRVLGELAIRLAWCYESSEGGKDVTSRINRWYKYSLNERRKAVNRWLPIMKDGDPNFAKELEKTLQQAQEQMNSMPEKLAPSLADSIQTLHPAAKVLFPMIYTRYLNAIHIDVKTLLELIEIKGSGIQFESDQGLQTPLELECQCLSITFTIVSIIWNYFNWDYTNFALEIFDITKKCNLPLEIDGLGIYNSIPWDEKKD